MQANNNELPESVFDAFAVIQSKLGRQQVMQMIGNSMRPCICHGDRLHVELHPARLRLGDVLIWQHQGRLIAHRLVAIRGEDLLLRGDANLVYDPPVLKSKIVGRIKGVEHATGFTDYSSARWRTVNLLMAKFSGICWMLLRFKNKATRLVEKIC
jgi:hypothetical protein